MDRAPILAFVISLLEFSLVLVLRPKTGGLREKLPFPLYSISSQLGAGVKVS